MECESEWVEWERGVDFDWVCESECENFVGLVEVLIVLLLFWASTYCDYDDFDGDSEFGVRGTRSLDDYDVVFDD